MKIKHVTMRLTGDERLELVLLKHAVEKIEARSISLQAVLRRAIVSQAAAPLIKNQYVGTRSVRLDLVVSLDVQQALQSLKTANPDLSVTDIVLCCARHMHAVLQAS